MLHHDGTVLSNLQLVTITLQGYGARAQVEAFGDVVVGSAWYAKVGAEYNVRPGAHVQKVVLDPPAAPPASRNEIATLIKQWITGGKVLAPAAIANQLLYMIYLYLPAEGRGADLAGVAGYHQMVTLGDARFPIVVILDSVGDGRGNALALTAARHLINAVTNPYEPPNDGYYADPPMIDPWSLMLGEAADLCDGETPVMEDAFTLPRVYSDAAAMKDEPPCLPRLPGDFWNDVSAEPSTMQMVSRGGSVTFELTGWSTKAVPPWKLTTGIADFSQLAIDDMQPELDETTINNGTIVNLTLHAPATAIRGAAGGIYVLSGANLHRWAVGFVVR